MLIVISVTLFFIVLRFTVTLFNFISNPKLTRVTRHYDDLVSILIPVRNEEENIVILLASILKQEYKNYEVIIYDDESDDNTYNVCVAFAAAHSNISLIKGTPLPAGWMGKNHACHQLARKARGKFLLFLDADDVIHPVTRHEQREAVAVKFSTVKPAAFTISVPAQKPRSGHRLRTIHVIRCCKLPRK